MNYKLAEVELTVNLRGSQAIRGSFDHYFKTTSKGEKVDALKTFRHTTFCDCSKKIHLSNEFVRGALAEPPIELRERYKVFQWLQLPEKKRIVTHVHNIVKALHPEHRGYSMSIL